MIKEKMLSLAIKVQTRGLYRGLAIAIFAMSIVFIVDTNVLALDSLSGGGTGSDIITALTEGAKKTFGSLALLSHPAAGLGIAIGALMKKFSMGRQDRVEMGNKLIKDTFIAWGTINTINAIIFFVTGLFD